MRRVSSSSFLSMILFTSDRLATSTVQVGGTVSPLAHGSNGLLTGGREFTDSPTSLPGEVCRRIVKFGTKYSQRTREAKFGAGLYFDENGRPFGLMGFL